MKIISYNVNGIRAALKKDFVPWLITENPDILCLQETKAQDDQIEKEMFENLGYHVFHAAAEKKGYSGVAIFSKLKPNNVEIGCGIPIFDNEGRWIRADYENFSLVSAYFPSGTTGEVRQGFKMSFLDAIYTIANDLKSKHSNLIISGDYNICHTPIDIHNPIANAHTSGFLPEERAWVSKFIESGFLDTFRMFHKEPNQYSWWSYRASARSKNLGWRIDYHMASEAMKSKIKNAKILQEVVHSDHCPIVLEIEN